MQYPWNERRGDLPVEGRERVVHDYAAGREWRVRLADCRDVPGSRGASCLIFDCGTMVRRVWSPSATWHLLPEEELLALVENGQQR